MNDFVIQGLDIAHYRGLNHLKVDNLSRINVFVGTNNSGKTSVLEAIKIMSAPRDISQLASIARLRANPPQEARRKYFINYLLSVFQKTTEKEDEKDQYFGIKMAIIANQHRYAYEADGTLDETSYNGEHYPVLDIAVATAVDGKKPNYDTYRFFNNDDKTIDAIENPVFNALYIHSSINLYRSCVKFVSKYIRQGGKAKILEVLTSFDSSITDVSIVNEDIYIDSSFSGTLPLFTYGLGLQKAVLLSSIIVNCQNGVVLIDEIDNAIHISAFEQVFSWFMDACEQYNIQAFITTHSIEAIDSIIKVAHKNYQSKDILRIVTLRNDKENNITRYKMRDGETAYSDRGMFGMELRV